MTSSLLGHGWTPRKNIWFWFRQRTPPCLSQRALIIDLDLRKTMRTEPGLTAILTDQFPPLSPYPAG